MLRLPLQSPFHPQTPLGIDPDDAVYLRAAVHCVPHRVLRPQLWIFQS
jgi:hypothetical protein